MLAVGGGLPRRLFAGGGLLTPGRSPVAGEPHEERCDPRHGQDHRP